MNKQSLLAIWLPVVLWTGVIAMESFFGAAANTAPFLQGLLWRLLGGLDAASFESLHFILRKAGHFLGYGIFGFLWFRAFSATFKRSAPLLSFGLAIGCTFLFASLDEWHQSFSPLRTGRFSDVALDTAGALVLVSMAVMAMRRRPLLERNSAS